MSRYDIYASLALIALLAQSSVAQCPHPAPASSLKAKSEDRSVLMTLLLTPSGKVRAVQVWPGADEFRTVAVKLAVRKHYHPTPGFAPDVYDVVVEFPRQGPPKIKEVHMGVSSCVYGGAPMGLLSYPTPASIEVLRLLLPPPVFPVPSADK